LIFWVDAPVFMGLFRLVLNSFVSFLLARTLFQGCGFVKRKNGIDRRRKEHIGTETKPIVTRATLFENQAGHVVWTSASQGHFNQNFQFNSQPTAMQFTLRRTSGGRAGASILLAAEDQEKALVFWGNTSFGLLVHWRIANKQQPGRGDITSNVLERLPVWDVTALVPDQLEKAAKVFDEICRRQLCRSTKSTKTRHTGS
jgi:hypothetical protein